MTNVETNTAPVANDAAIILADVFAAIRKASDTNDKVTGNLILGLFTHEASFSSEQLEYYFKTEPAKRKDVQTRILSQNDDEFKNEMRFLEVQAEKDKRDRDADAIETVMRRHKSLRNIFHSCMQACYFLRTGGDLAGNSIGPVKSLKLVKDRFIVSYIDEDKEVTRLQGKFSSAALIKSGVAVVDKLLAKPAKASTAKSVNTSPVSILNSAASTIGVMLDQAINETTTAMKANGQTVERATLDDMPDEVTNNLDSMLVKLIKAKFAHEGTIEANDIFDWLTDTMKDVKVVDGKIVKRKVA
jgi:hypothetical protein